MNADYPYTAEDRLRHPHGYMFTPFEGPAFFDAYGGDRRRTLAAYAPRGAGLSGAVARAVVTAAAGLSDPGLVCPVPREEIDALPLAAAAPGMAAQAVPPLPADTAVPFETLPTLRAMLEATAAGSAEAESWIEFFVRRFEISKCLRLRYNHPEGLAAPHADLAPYALFAAALALSCQGKDDFRRLNALLKCGDLIGSVRGRENPEPHTAALCAAAVVLELAAVNRMLGQQGIAP